MTLEQTALVVREAIRQAASEWEVRPSQALSPDLNSPSAIAARNIAICLAFDQGVEPRHLAEAFRRDRRVIRMALTRTQTETP
jgi:hypothetical protein